MQSSACLTPNRSYTTYAIGSAILEHNKEIIMQKIFQILRSRKFWALIASAVTVAGAYSTGQIAGDAASNSLVAALAAYSIATGIEAH